jgi:hypothetical protein
MEEQAQAQASAAQAEALAARRRIANSSWDVYLGKKQRYDGVLAFSGDGSCQTGNCTWNQSADIVSIVMEQTDKSKDCRVDWSLTLDQDKNTLTGSLTYSGKTSFFGPNCNGTLKVVMRRRQ